MGKWGSGHVYLQSGAWHLQFYQIEKRADGGLARIRKSKRLCDAKGVSKKYANRLAADEMKEIDTRATTTAEDVPVSLFWEKHFLPYCEEIITMTGNPRKKPSTMKGYRQIWRQHLEKHFGTTTLQQYNPRMGSTFLDSLTATQGKTTLKHIKALGGSIFKRALVEGRIKVNPWTAVLIPEDAVAPGETAHYTLEQVEDMISALVDHVDAQLVLALACFVGLRRGEIAGLKWEDCDGAWIHIRRNFVCGEIVTPKSKAAGVPVPIIDPVRVPLELWRAKCGGKTAGWMFREDGPLDINNMVNRVLIPHVNGGRKCVPCNKTPIASKVRWAGLHAGRRGVGTMVIDATGNIAVAQALLRHEKASTTAAFYKKQIAAKSYAQGIADYQKALTKGQ